MKNKQVSNACRLTGNRSFKDTAPRYHSFPPGPKIVPYRSNGGAEKKVVQGLQQW